MAVNYKVIVRRGYDGFEISQLSAGYVRKKYAESMKKRWAKFNPRMVPYFYVELIPDNVIEEALEQIKENKCTTQ